MGRTTTLLLCAVAAATSSQRACADYLINGGELSGTSRISNSGQHKLSYVPPPEALGAVETIGEDFAVTPDLGTVYQFTNSLGYSEVIFAYDINTGQYLSDQTLHSGFGFPPVDDSIINPRMSLIRTNDPLGAGDLFTITSVTGYPFGSTPQIKRFNRETDSYVETIDPPSPQGIYDFAFGPDNHLYMAARDGIFLYEETISGFELVSTTPLIGSLTGTIAFGPDGRLYVRDVVSGDITRYTTQGTFIDTFIPVSEIPSQPASSQAGDYFLPGRGSIQFGVDGNLHININSEAIARYHGTAGDLIHLTQITFGPTYLMSLGRITYLPIPEPNSLLMALVGGLGIVRRGRRP